MPDLRLAIPDPQQYRFAVYCCSFKLDLGNLPEHAMALFPDQGMAVRYGAWMWPTTFQVVDLQADKEADR